ncbi:hypothetical protein RRG08_023963 [Elysia crispata]|uniref:Uncharacterized protein n=1 Tax=Elysia crispata TaxID=231223 RepID=A0AAE0YN86_9GAST|nr:hypothetical protein RRG08_023963 [Elysia crispata]
MPGRALENRLRLQSDLSYVKVSTRWKEPKGFRGSRLCPLGFCPGSHHKFATLFIYGREDIGWRYEDEMPMKRNLQIV